MVVSGSASPVRLSHGAAAAGAADSKAAMAAAATAIRMINTFLAGRPPPLAGAPLNRGLRPSLPIACPGSRDEFKTRLPAPGCRLLLLA